jgi:peptidoglycan/LPS O-acetylase OafA/YrhL
LGKISYGLYVYHLPIYWFALDIGDLGVRANWVNPIATIITFFGTILLASISYRFIEKPLLNLKDHFFPVRHDENSLLLASHDVVTRPSNLRNAHH